MSTRLTTNKRVWELHREYVKNDKSEHLRFGQWVVNTYLRDGIRWPELFYAEGSKAFQILKENGHA